MFQEELGKKVDFVNETQTDSTTVPLPTNLTSPVKSLIANFDSLSDTTKKAPKSVALSLNNYEFQRELFSKMGLVTQDDTSKQAKLAKELIKLANTYNVPELKFSEQASKHRLAYTAWITKLKTILSMFPSTMNLIGYDFINPFPDAICFQNKAVFLLIGSKVDAYFLKK